MSASAFSAAVSKLFALAGGKMVPAKNQKRPKMTPGANNGNYALDLATLLRHCFVIGENR
jgi:hypothetical protein